MQADRWLQAAIPGPPPTRYARARMSMQILTCAHDGAGPDRSWGRPGGRSAPAGAAAGMHEPRIGRGRSVHASA